VVLNWWVTDRVKAEAEQAHKLAVVEKKLRDKKSASLFMKGGGAQRLSPAR